MSPGCMILSDRCDVYVWGSNSSHQLAVGSQEKILQPKASTAFTDVQQVCRSTCPHYIGQYLNYIKLPLTFLCQFCETSTSHCLET